ncbi:penicillin acylase family protein [Paraliomyxa miuraensis]|uniref:penicillin acylase family protein n=1 Tax=Paraliomyxa miuraensis TaxID=376150 RepID=UPI0022557A06|nr:penicillin acylase family protein [Paraliomyxa miuraensis]MCX4243582.1 penicillin acylase family protein [Paraliomyxa miuraensis]
MPRWRAIARGGLAGVVVGALGCGLTPGELVAGPSEPVEIRWDRWQVPHVRARSREGVAYGLGYAQLRAYPEELLQLYAVARGEAAEHWGTRYRSSDRMVRTLGLAEHAERDLAGASAGLRAELEAFARGMNDYAAAHPEAIPRLARRVLPVRPSDPLAHGRRVLLCFLLLTGQRPLVLSIDGEVMPTVAGSNLWAIGPSRSASGHAMLLANPHLPWGPPALRMFEAHLRGPDAPLYGATLLGFPVLMLGFNDAIAWSHTVNVLDAADLYELRPQEGGYRFDGEVRPFEEHTETMRVKRKVGWPKKETVRIRRSVHGPVIELADGRLMAVRTGLDDVGAGWLETWAAMGRARTLEEFEGALRTGNLPMFTVGYADRDGHVLYLSAGRIFDRRGTPEGGDFGTWWGAPLPGDTSTALWTEQLPYEALPRVIDPPSGFVQNGNGVPWLATLPSPFPAEQPAALPPRRFVGMRELHGLRMLLDDEAIDFDELRALRYDSRLELADHVLDDLLSAAARAEPSGLVPRAAAVLTAWDRTAAERTGSHGATLFEAWARRAMARPDPFAVPWSEQDPLRTPMGLREPSTALEDLEAAALEVEAAHGRLDPPWAQVHRFRDDLPGAGASGEALGSFFTIEHEPGKGGSMHPMGGDTFVAIVELRPEGPRAEVVLAYGNASPNGPHGGDQLELLATGTMRAPRLDSAEIDAEAVESVRLVMTR